MKKAKGTQLFEDDDTTERADFVINRKFAKQYETRKKQNHLKELQSRYSEEESTSEEEDEVGALFNGETDKQITKVIGLLREKDTQKKNDLYSGESFFNNSIKENDGVSGKTGNLHLTVKDYIQKELLEEQVEDLNDREVAKLPYAQQTELDRKNFIEEAEKAVNVGEEDFLRVRKKHKGESKDKTAEPFSALFSKAPQEDEGEKILRELLVGKKYIQGVDSDKIPTYDEIMEDNTSEEERTEEFEREVNFRFEEQGGTSIQTYGRKVDSVREEKTRRVALRAKKRETLEKEAKKRKEEKQKMRNIKKDIIKEKVKLIEEISGERFDMLGDELDEEFDPVKFNSTMENIFNEKYYEGDDDGFEPDESDFDEDKFDSFLDSVNETGKLSKRQRRRAKDKMRADFNGNRDHESRSIGNRLKNDEIGSEKKEYEAERELTYKEVRKLKKLHENIHQDLDEYMNVGAEDVVEGNPINFDYIKVKPKTYNMNLEDILEKDEAELRSLLPIKKMAPYARGGREKGNSTGKRTAVSTSRSRKKGKGSEYSEKFGNVRRDRVASYYAPKKRR